MFSDMPAIVLPSQVPQRRDTDEDLGGNSSPSGPMQSSSLLGGHHFPQHYDNDNNETSHSLLSNGGKMGRLPPNPQKQQQQQPGLFGTNNNNLLNQPQQTTTNPNQLDTFSLDRPDADVDIYAHSLPTYMDRARVKWQWAERSRIAQREQQQQQQDTAAPSGFMGGRIGGLESASCRINNKVLGGGGIGGEFRDEGADMNDMNDMDEEENNDNRTHNGSYRPHQQEGLSSSFRETIPQPHAQQPHAQHEEINRAVQLVLAQTTNNGNGNDSRRNSRRNSRSYSQDLTQNSTSLSGSLTVFGILSSSHHNGGLGDLNLDGDEKEGATRSLQTMREAMDRADVETSGSAGSYRRSSLSTSISGPGDGFGSRPGIVRKISGGSVGDEMDSSAIFNHPSLQQQRQQPSLLARGVSTEVEGVGGQGQRVDSPNDQFNNPDTFEAFSLELDDE
jgi:hypothetical protein